LTGHAVRLDVKLFPKRLDMTYIVLNAPVNPNWPTKHQ